MAGARKVVDDEVVRVAQVLGAAAQDKAEADGDGLRANHRWDRGAVRVAGGEAVLRSQKSVGIADRKVIVQLIRQNEGPLRSIIRNSELPRRA